MYGGHPYGGAAYGDQQAGALVLVDYAGGGTLSYSGSSAENVTYAFAGSGALSLSGSSVECVTRGVEIGSGTLAFTGEADVDFVEAWAGTSILDFSGSSEQSFTWAWHGSGEIALEGGAEYEFAAIPASSGGGGYPLGRWIGLPTSPRRFVWAFDGCLIVPRTRVSHHAAIVHLSPLPKHWSYVGAIAVSRLSLTAATEFFDPWAEARRQDEAWLLSGEWFESPQLELACEV